jgi:lysozyme family protein
MSAPVLSKSLREEYENLFDTCQINDGKLSSVDNLIATIQANEARYEAVGTPLGIPWYFIAVIHSMESSLSFQKHLHNGDPLTARTVHVPAGRPVTGNPPFTWEESATDALTLEGLNHVKDWTLAGTLYRIEKYNGFGYRTLHHINTPYLWSWSNQYTSGKYVADGTFDPDAVSQQGGAAVLLRRMTDQGIIAMDTTTDPIAAIEELAAQVTISSQRSDAARALQEALNGVPGIQLTADGVPGSGTSTALQQVTGHYLSGDPRAVQAAGGA